LFAHALTEVVEVVGVGMDVVDIEVVGVVVVPVVVVD
jgi:hypothetical protein